ncbi:MAG: hypothetical protein ACD_19C00087G0001 [uncultured bacterium]|nr:MAG: hypothetical protein ACD_19C00087G0001 [uncultured bacterium]OGM13936.1 MAG: hypothetical protein A2W15_02590 [Candidatus Woesebacteria bacterium RBG_16_41_13]
MKNKFNLFKQLYQDNKFDTLLKEEGSVYWLKLRSISRKELMINFCQFANIDCTDIPGSTLFQHIYEKQPTEKLVDNFILEQYKRERSFRKQNETKLVSELYKLQALDWGGIYQNNLEKTIIDNYVKKIQDFELLNKKIENEIHLSMRGYVQSSWYNHWTSILIEDIFKDQQKVVPTVGLIKKVDFFIDNVPFDLKVTYFPEGYMSVKRKLAGMSSEIQTMKRFAKSEGMKFDTKQKDKALFTELMTRFRESTNNNVKSFYQKFCNERWSLVEQSIENNRELIQWLYEEQGERRFDAANRLFLVLIDKDSLEDSWKMKRNTELLSSAIGNYVNKFSSKNLQNLEVKFDWMDGKTYTATSDVIFVIKNN